MILLSLLLTSPLISTTNAQTETKMDAIQVIGHRQSENLVDFIPSVSKISGKKLNSKRQTSLGDTIQGEPGVSSTSFGPSASRPVIRGLDGDRVRVLQNGLGTLDASTQSVDHAIPIDPLTIDQIEIVRGPMSLLYGSSAVGGVVNVLTNRIKTQFEQGFSAQIQSQGETVNHGLSNALRADFGKANWMVHADASTRNLGNQRIPGYARTEHKRATEPFGSNKTEGNKILPNSFNKQENQAIGVTRVFDKGAFGVSYNHFESDYGTVAEQQVAINMNQNRYELSGEYESPISLFRKFKIKSAQSDYKHREKDKEVVGTTFKNSGNESRLEAINSSDKFDGITGIQTQYNNFQAIGSEAFLPKSKNERVALFTYQELKADKHSYSAGLRAESVGIQKQVTPNFGPAMNKDFMSYNSSVGYLYRLRNEDSISISFSYTERAPNFQELFAGGPHIATGTYEQGFDRLRKEEAYAIETGYKFKNDKNSYSANLFAQKFDGFILLAPSGDTDATSSLPISRYNQLAATFYGADAEATNQIWQTSSGVLHLNTKADIVRGYESSSKNNLPRITPPRLTLGLDYGTDKWSIEGEVVKVMRQTKTAPNETQTKSYALTNIGYNYNFLGEKTSLSTFFKVRNIFNEEARNHVSTLKDIAPLPGRNVVVGLELTL